MLTLEAQGGVLTVRRNLKLTPLKQSRGGRRGIVTAFSRASRRRLIELFSRLDITRTRTTFVTLTFAGSPSGDEAKRALKQFTMRLRRAYPEMSAVWRLEPQKRGSWHFHLLAFNMPFLPQQELQQSWTECTGEARSIAHIQLVRFGKRQLMSYASKYMAKVTAPEPSLDNAAYQHEGTDQREKTPGRFWGYVNREALPFAPRRMAMIEDDDMENYLWYSARWITNGGTYRPLKAFRLYTYPPHELLDWIIKHSHLILFDQTNADGSPFRWTHLVDF